MARGLTHRIVNADFSGFHALTCGFEARDPSYMRAARMDIHGILGYIKEKLDGWETIIDHIKNGTGNDKDILGQVKVWARKNVEGFKERRDTQYKRVVLGNQFGMRGRKLWMLYPDSFPDIKTADAIIQQEIGIWPRIFAWQDEIREQAHTQHYLLSRHGYIRWFWDVKHKHWNQYKGRWEWASGEDSEKVVAFLPANDAFGTIRKAMLRIHAEDLDEKYGMYNTVHDSLKFHCKISLVDECLERISGIMQAPNPVLTDPVCAPQGLSCLVEAKVGIDGAHMEEVKLG